MLAEIPFEINCLWRRSARSAGLAVRNTLSAAPGKTTVPMSRPSATRPGARRKASCSAVQRAAHGRVRRDARGQQAGALQPQFVGHVAPAQPACGRRRSAGPGRRPGAPRRLRRRARRRPTAPPARWRGTARRSRAGASPGAAATPAASVPLPEAVGPSMVITGTSSGAAAGDAEQRLEVVREGLGHAARVEDAQRHVPARQRVEGRQRQAHRHAVVVVGVDHRRLPARRRRAPR